MNAATASTDVLISRSIAAPREAVFAAWSSVDSLMSWFAPHGCAIAYKRFDFREGGEYLSCIRTPDGYECWCKGEYLKIVEAELIEFSMEVSDAEGNAVEPTAMGMDPEWPARTVCTVTFEESNGGTLLSLHQTVNEELAKRTGAQPSWLQMLDRLEQELTGAGR